MTLLNVEGYSSLKKDPSTGGVINTDRSSYQEYMKSRAAAQRIAQTNLDTAAAVSDLQGKINSMESEMSEIKQLLIQLIHKGN